MTYLWLTAALLSPVVAVMLTQLIDVGRVSNKITAHGLAGLLAYFIMGQLMRRLVGIGVWPLVAGLAAAAGVGLVFRLEAKHKQQRAEMDKQQAAAKDKQQAAANK